MGMTCIIVEKPSVARELAAIVGADSRGNGHMERNYQDPRTCSVKAHTGELINKMGFLLFYDIFQCSVIIAQKRTTAGGKYEYVFLVKAMLKRTVAIGWHVGQNVLLNWSLLNRTVINQNRIF